MKKFLPILVVLLAAALVVETALLIPLWRENSRLKLQQAYDKERAVLASARPIGWGDLTTDQRASMVAELKSAGATNGAVWFLRAANDSGVARYQRVLQSVFEEAGWEIKQNAVANFPLRPGVFFLAADDSPPSYVLAAQAAFQDAQIDMSVGRGYRAFHEQKKAEDENWRGIDMAEDQHYVIAIGRRPTEQ